ncbi:MAG: DNA internalization-related competence protein ComEC/Rec2 [Bacteroidota bacterium]|nr:DNA internalization-related competence protein ComEC/Rec2 [Bacteroidota bacterium]
MGTDLYRLLNRPAVKTLPAFAVGIACAEHPCIRAADITWAAALVLWIASVLVVFSVERARWRPWRDASLLALATATGLLAGRDAWLNVDTALLSWSDSGMHIVIHGIVDQQPVSRPGRMTFIMRVSGLSYQPLGDTCVAGKTYVTVYDLDTGTSPGIDVGDTLTLRGTLASGRPARNPGAFDHRSWLNRIGVSTTFTAQGRDVTLCGRGHGGSFPASSLRRLRSVIALSIERLFPPSDVPLMKAFLLGERGYVDEETILSLRRAGIVHIIALSGLHVGIILTVIWVPLGRLPFGIRAPIASVALWSFVFITGAAPPVMRAAVMASAVLAAYGFQRPAHTMNTLASAGIAILAVSPAYLFDPGFQLSFSAVTGIVLFQPRIASCIRRLLPAVLEGNFFSGSVVSLSALTVAAQLGTAPFLASLFGEISLISLVANLVAVPLAFVVVACGMVALLLSGVGPFPSLCYASASSAALRLITGSADVLAGFSFASIRIPALPGWVPCLYVFFLWMLFFRPRPFRARLLFCALVLTAVLTVVSAVGTPSKETELLVLFLDVGQGDAVVVRTPAGKCLVIDSGPSFRESDAGRRTIVPVLRGAGIHRIDALFVTHPDDDHIGGACSLLSSMGVDSVVLPVGWPMTPAARALDSVSHACKVAVRRVHPGVSLPVDPSIRLYVLSSERPACARSDANNGSLCLLLRYGSTAYLFTGDADTTVERLIVERFGDALRCDVFKAGHHGSASSNGNVLLRTAAPREIVVSCGRHNRFGHPKAAALRRMVSCGARVHRTDIDGAVIFASGGDSVRRVTW